MLVSMVRQTTVLALTLGLAACATATGPVFGDWRGDQPGRITGNPRTVELVLDGPPGATSGDYHLATTEHDADPLAGGQGTRRWGDRWTSEQRMMDGRMQTIIALHNALPGDISRYSLLPDGALHALDPSGQVDQSPAGRLYVLSPVAPGPGYGRS